MDGMLARLLLLLVVMVAAAGAFIRIPDMRNWGKVQSIKPLGGRVGGRELL